MVAPPTGLPVAFERTTPSTRPVDAAAAPDDAPSRSGASSMAIAMTAGRDSERHRCWAGDCRRRPAQPTSNNGRGVWDLRIALTSETVRFSAGAVEVVGPPYPTIGLRASLEPAGR